MIYLDNAATTQIAPFVKRKMRPYLNSRYGNPGSIHKMGTEALFGISQARQRVAMALNCSPEQIIFTAGGSESNNMILRGVFDHLKETGRTRILASAVEHDSIMNTLKYLMSLGATVELLPVTEEGLVKPETLKSLMDDSTGLVSIMYTNNELGTTNNIYELCDVAHSGGALFHTDCVQAFGKIELDMKEIGCDFASFSGHKIYAPKGVGCAYVNSTEYISPLIFGGPDQEFGLRGGTENVASIVGMGAACEKIKSFISKQNDVQYIKALFYYRLIRNLAEKGLGNAVRLNVDLERSGNIISLRINGVDSETFIYTLSNYGVCISAGSACTSHLTLPSYVLTAAGLKDYEAMNTVRISFSPFMKKSQVKRAADIMSRCIYKFLTEPIIPDFGGD